MHNHAALLWLLRRRARRPIIPAHACCLHTSSSCWSIHLDAALAKILPSSAKPLQHGQHNTPNSTLLGDAAMIDGNANAPPNHLASRPLHEPVNNGAHRKQPPSRAFDAALMGDGATTTDVLRRHHKRFQWLSQALATHQDEDEDGFLWDMDQEEGVPVRAGLMQPDDDGNDGDGMSMCSMQQQQEQQQRRRPSPWQHPALIKHDDVPAMHGGPAQEIVNPTLTTNIIKDDTMPRSRTWSQQPNGNIPHLEGPGSPLFGSPSMDANPFVPSLRPSPRASPSWRTPTFPTPSPRPPPPPPHASQGNLLYPLLYKTTSSPPSLQPFPTSTIKPLPFRTMAPSPLAQQPPLPGALGSQPPPRPMLRFSDELLQQYAHLPSLRTNPHEQHDGQPTTTPRLAPSLHLPPVQKQAPLWRRSLPARQQPTGARGGARADEPRERRRGGWISGKVSRRVHVVGKRYPPIPLLAPAPPHALVFAPHFTSYFPPDAVKKSLGNGGGGGAHIKDRGANGGGTGGSVTMEDVGGVGGVENTWASTMGAPLQSRAPMQSRAQSRTMTITNEEQLAAAAARSLVAPVVLCNFGADPGREWLEMVEGTVRQHNVHVRVWAVQGLPQEDREQGWHDGGIAEASNVLLQLGEYRSPSVFVLQHGATQASAHFESDDPLPDIMHWILSHVEAGCPLESSTSNSESDSEHQPLGHQPLRHQSLGHPLPGDKRIPNENCIRGDKLSGGHNHHDTATGLGVAGIEGATTTEGVGVEGVGVEKAAAGGGVAVRVGEVVDAGAVEVMATRLSHALTQYRVNVAHPLGLSFYLRKNNNKRTPEGVLTPPSSKRGRGRGRGRSGYWFAQGWSDSEVDEEEEEGEWGMGEIKGKVMGKVTTGELCGELAAIIGLTTPEQWQQRCQLLGMLAVAYTTQKSLQWLADARLVLGQAEQIMQDHGVLSLEGVRKGQAAVALATAIQQRGVMECDSKRMELDLSITTLLSKPMRMKKMHDAALWYWYQGEFRGAVRMCHDAIALQTGILRPGDVMEANVREIADQVARFDAANVMGRYAAMDAAHDEMVRLLQLMLITLGKDHFLARSYQLRMAGLRLQERDAVVQQRLSGLKTTFVPPKPRVEGVC